MKISIVTISKNSKTTIERNLKSILNQTHRNYEHIIVNNIYGEDIAEIVNRYPNTIYINSDDSGIYDAMNKGVAISSGGYVCFLNSDDYFINNKNLELVSNIASKSYNDIIYGDLLYEKKEFGIIEIIRKWSGEINSSKYIKNVLVPPHPCTFYRSNLFKKQKFDVTYKISGDYELYLRLQKIYKLNEYYDHQIVACANQFGVSSSRVLAFKEDLRALDGKSKFKLFMAVIKRIYKINQYSYKLKKVSMVDI